MSRIEIKDGVWTIPAARYKTGVDTDVPLSAAALEVLERLPRIGADKYVFTRDGERPFQGHSSAKAKLDKACQLSDWVIHDLRRTGATVNLESWRFLESSPSNALVTSFRAFGPSTIGIGTSRRNDARARRWPLSHQAHCQSAGRQCCRHRAGPKMRFLITQRLP